MRRFFSDQIDTASSTAELGAEEAHHARSVLRLKADDEIAVFDGEGREFECRILSLTGSRAELAILREIEPSAPESPLDLTLASVVIPGERYDLIVQKAVELGVRKLIPLGSLRCELKLKDIAKRDSRWRRIALDASKQSGRARLMKIAEPMDVVRLLAKTGEDESGAKVFFSERNGGSLPREIVDSKLTIVIGPKGGWDDTELEAARAAGFTIVTLGGRIMRAETAAISLTAILQNRFGDIN